MINDDELRDKVWDDYGDILVESPHEIVNADGVIRWKASRLGQWLGKNVDLNKMAIAYQQGLFSLAEYKEFYREMGYSLSGFKEIFEDERL